MGAQRRLTPSQSHRPELDGIRGIAIGLVLAAHLDLPLGGGWAGVELFFVLSGYLITGILADERRRTGRTSLLGFYQRRIRRLAPALLALLTVLVVAGLASWSQVAVVAGYVANWARVGSMELGPLAHTWSLAIEEQYYLAWPLLAGLFLRRGIVPVLLVCAVLATVARLAVLPHGAADYATPLRADGFLVGAALALWGGRLPGSTVAIVALVLLTPLANALDARPAAWPYAIGTLLSAVAIAGAGPGWLSWRPIRWLGEVSYAAYLWHWPMVWFLMPSLGPVPVLVLSLVFAWASTRFVEAPFRRVGRPAPPGC